MTSPENRRRTNQRRILRDRGLLAPTPILPSTPVPARDSRKSWRMLYIEGLEGKPLEELLYSDKIVVLAQRWGVNWTTISKWRKRLGLIPEVIDRDEQ